MTVTGHRPATAGTLHELACTGPDADDGCVCITAPRSMMGLTAKSEAHRERAESLVRGTEVLLRRFAELEVVPLDVLDRMERAIVEAHTANLLRLPGYARMEAGE